MDCSSPAVHGAHVLLADHRYNRNWWIVPFCAKCNNPHNTEPRYIEARTMLVSAVVADCKSGKTDTLRLED